LPVATQRQIAATYGAGATAVATSTSPGSGTDVTAGLYLISNPPSGGAPLLASASNGSAALAYLPEGAGVQATGENANFFARVTTGVASQSGWVSVMYLTPAPATGAGSSGGLTLTFAEKLQLRTILAAWSQATSGVPVYGVNSGDFAQTALADGTQAMIVAAFQRWRGGLRTDGVVDDATRAAITGWAQQALTGAPNPNQLPAFPVPGLPGAPPAIPGAPTPLALSEPPAEPSSGGAAPVLLLGAAALLGLLLLEQKKKGKRK
jgi:hypothetical protein